MERLLALREKKDMLEQRVFVQRPDLTDEHYQLIEKTGELHYLSQLVNQNCSKDPNTVEAKFKCQCGCGKFTGDHVPYCLDVE